MARLKVARLTSIASKVVTLDIRSAKPAPKEVDPHYLTPEHQAWRAEVISRAGGRCQYLGCGRKEQRMFADHIKERSDGGEPYDVRNGQCLCGSHHTLKTIRKRAERFADPPGGQS